MPGLQHLLLRTLPYDFNVSYIKGSTNLLADCFSRARTIKEKTELPIVQVHETTCRLLATANRIQLLHVATAQGDDL